MKAAPLTLSFLLIGGMLPAALSAQAPATAAPATHYITVSRFAMPDDTLQRRLVLMWIDTVMVPQSKLDPNVTSMTVAMHNWGANSRDAVVIAEYPTWEAIQADCKACDDWFTARQPKAGTPERARWDAAGEAFRKAYLGHRDEIYVYGANRAKR